jgi:hypothetical protein
MFATIPFVFRKGAAMTTTQTPTISARSVWLILIVVLLADAMDLIDSTITNIAAPSIVADLGADDSLIKWLGAAYALALGSLLVLGAGSATSSGSDGPSSSGWAGSWSPRPRRGSRSRPAC